MMREDYRGILARSGKGLDVKLLLSALQQSLEFEYYLEKRFSQTVISGFYGFWLQERESLDTFSSKGEERTLIFGKTISEAFEPHLSLYIDSQDQYISELNPANIESFRINYEHTNQSVLTHRKQQKMNPHRQCYPRQPISLRSTVKLLLNVQNYQLQRR